MVNAWSLLYEELNGTMDETYPIKRKGKMTDKNEDDVVILGGESSDTITFTSDGIGAADTVSLDQSWWADDGFSVTGNPAGASQDTLNLGPTRLPGGMGEDHISSSLDVGAGNTAWDWDPGLAHTHYDDPKYYSDINGLVAGSVDDVYSFHYPGPDTKPKPNLKYQQQKYGEDKGIKDLKDYVSSTYQGHYTNDNSDVQTLDLIHSVGDAESFCRSNAIKYLSRYDKKGQAKRDILKAMHYCLLLYYFSGNTNNEITTRGYETF